MKEFIFVDPAEESFAVIAGESAKENWELIDRCGQRDLWFHLANDSSPHVVIRLKDKQKPSKSVINYAALICKENSKHRNRHQTKVMWTLIKHVKKADRVGAVYTSREKYLTL